MKRLTMLLALPLAVACADKLTGPDAQTAAREYQSKTIADNKVPLVFVNGNEVSVDSIRAFPSHRIESVEVIKGARAIELHGARAQNGVILVVAK